jgi:serine/threonine protein kinase/tetratricopeptide (TPR) repeat protein
MTRNQTPSEDIADCRTIVDADAQSASEPIPVAIGSYDIKGAIGAGAMGVVYLARQSSPERDVAIKVMKSGVVSRKAMRRFEFEAKTLGRLQHPAIAQIYEASTWDDGEGARPFFAMEYVQDAKELGDFVQDNQLDTSARLELFSDACEGVEYGHRRGVIHRDLKPGNILVDAEGHPKIIDFGVARSTDSDSVSATLATEAGQLIGTLQYMSPEQVELDPADLDTRSDVYALGVILYQLLVDRLPYDLTGTSLTQAASRIRELQPRRLGEIKSHLKGDLETICLKALEKDREQRYQSVNDLVEDIRRYLADEPIMARPPTRTEQFRRFVRKNKAASLATCVVALALVAATTISVVFAVEAGRQRDEAGRQQAIAESKTTEVQSQAENMRVMVNFQAKQLSNIDVTKMGKSLREEMMAELQLEPGDTEYVDFTGAAARLLQKHIFEPTLESINSRYVEQPLVQARLLQTLSESLMRIGLLKQALEPQSHALELRTEHLGTEDERTLKSIRMLADLLYNSGKFDESIIYEEELLDIRRRTLGDEHAKTMAEMNHLANTYNSLEMFDKAEQFRLEVLEISRRKWGDEHRRTLDAMEELGDLYRRNDDLVKAFPYYKDALAIRRGQWGDDDPDTLNSLEDMGELLQDQKKYEEAEPYFTQVLEVLQKTRGNEHPKTLMAMEEMGELFYAQGKYDEAFALFRDKIAVQRRKLGSKHPSTLYTLHLLAIYLDNSNRDEEAVLGMYIESLEGFRYVGGEDSPRVLDTLERITNHLFYDLERYDEAEIYLGELIPLQRRTIGNEHPDTLDSIILMSKTLFKQKKYDEAEPYFAERIALSRQLLGNDDPVTLTSMNMMGRVLRLQGKYDEAKSHYIECIDARRRILGDDHPDTLTTISNLVYLLMKQGRYHEAMPIQLKVLADRRRILGVSNTSSISSLKRVILLFEAWHKVEPGAGHDATAAKYQAELDDVISSTAENVNP